MSGGGAEFARIRLNGARFTGGRLPLNALPEIQRYQALVLAAARREWQEAHPGEELPEDFDDALGLVIASVEPGSAVVLLERESEVVNTYDDEFDSAGAEVLRELTILLDGSRAVGEAPLFEYREFQMLGTSLERGEQLQIVAPRGGTDPAAEITLTADEVSNDLAPRVQELKRNQRRLLRINPQTVAGRLIALDADKQAFKLNSLLFGELDGRYKRAALTSDLKAVLNTSAIAPVIRVRADLQFRDDKPWRIRDVDDVELFEVDGEPWSRKLIELASLGPDWDGESLGAQIISFSALDAARDIVMQVSNSGLRRPGIFPTVEGGVSLEWVSSEVVASIEISPEVDSFYLHRIEHDQESGSHEETLDLERVIQFALGVAR